jgi:hypothetical protein
MGGFQGRRAGSAGDSCGMVARELPNVNRYGLGILIDGRRFLGTDVERRAYGLRLREIRVEKCADGGNFCKDRQSYDKAGQE